MVPGVIMVAIGGKSIMDASPQVIHGIVDQIVQIRDAGRSRDCWRWRWRES